jgi:Cu-Zn family superoxide dismutase
MKVRSVFNCSLLAAGLALAAPALADEVVIDVHAISADGVGKSVGTVIAMDTEDGLKLVPALAGLPPGEHGFHIHQNPSCDPAEKDGKAVAGLAAGGHYDPEGTHAHMGPKSDKGHLGDLPRLVVAEDGTASTAVIAPRLTAKAIKGRSLMVHASGDNYSDDPKPLGGGGARIACGLIE